MWMAHVVLHKTAERRAAPTGTLQQRTRVEGRHPQLVDQSAQCGEEEPLEGGAAQAAAVHAHLHVLPAVFRGARTQRREGIQCMNPPGRSARLR